MLFCIIYLRKCFKYLLITNVKTRRAGLEQILRIYKTKKTVILLWIIHRLLRTYQNLMCLDYLVIWEFLLRQPEKGIKMYVTTD